MVSKVAVIALVAVLAVPILLGYGLSLSEVQETDYSPNNDSMNITQLLQNSTAYTYANADTYSLNTNVKLNNTELIPYYEKFSDGYSSFNGGHNINHNFNPNNRAYTLTNYNYYYISMNYSTANGSVTATITDENNTPFTINNLNMFYWDNKDKIGYYLAYDGMSPQALAAGSVPNAVQFNFTGSSSSFRVDMEHWYSNAASQSNNYYVDLSAGFHLTGVPNATNGSGWSIVLPEQTRSVLFTINLDSITDANYSLRISTHYLEKTTTNGVVSWKAISFVNGVRDHEYDLYYDPDRSDNTYQIFMDQTKLRSDSTYNYYNIHTEYRYVGSWPQLFGPANYYQTVSWDTETRLNITSPNQSLQLALGTTNGYVTITTPTIRVDAAEYAAFTYPAIENKTFYPASFKDNPITTFKNPQYYGSSIVFGGQTFTPDKDGNITIGTHAVSLNNVKFTSYAVPGGYVNKINDYTISTTSEPSFIRLYGTWSFGTVEVDSQTVNTYTKTEWIPGEFAWDGIDTNFLIAGLISCLGVFIALGIYLRRTKSTMWPLLIVCGCAAGLFICMI